MESLVQSCSIEMDHAKLPERIAEAERALVIGARELSKVNGDDCEGGSVGERDVRLACIWEVSQADEVRGEHVLACQFPVGNLQSKAFDVKWPVPPFPSAPVTSDSCSTPSPHYPNEWGRETAGRAVLSCGKFRHT